MLLSSEGVQQGDTIRSLLFGLIIHKLSAKMRSEFPVYYWDGGTLGGNKEDVVHDVKNIEVEAEALGLMLKRKKTELICKDPTSRRLVLGALPGVCIINPEDANHLGSPIRGLQLVDIYLKEKIELLRLMGERLKPLQSHDTIDFQNNVYLWLQAILLVNHGGIWNLDTRKH